MSTKASLLPQMARLFAARAGLYCVSALIAGALGIAAVLVLVSRMNLLDRLLSSPPAMQFGLRLSLTYVPALLVLILANICFTLIYREASGQEIWAASKTMGAVQS